MFEGADEGLHIELGVDFVGAEVSQADFDFIAELSGLFFGLSDAGFVALRNLDGGGSPLSAARGRPESAKRLDEPFGVEDTARGAGFDGLDPFVGDGLVPIVGDGAGKNLNPELFVGIGAELSESAGNAGERVDLEVVESLDLRAESSVRVSSEE